jgi:hypothetical protein
MSRLIIVALAAACLAASAPAAAAAPAGPVLLTGDSTMYVMQDALSQELTRAGAEVRTESYLGSGLTRNFVFGWIGKAFDQAAAVKPAVTVVSLGAGDVYGLRDARGRRVRCCDAAWIAAYARRAGRLLAAWQREGEGVVYWLTLPVPGPKPLRRFNAAVDRAVSRAAALAGPHARRIDLDAVFTPRGRYRRTMTWLGRRVVVRERDGVHLTVAGSWIAALAVRSRLQRDGVL